MSAPRKVPRRQVKGFDKQPAPPKYQLFCLWILGWLVALYQWSVGWYRFLWD